MLKRIICMIALFATVLTFTGCNRNNLSKYKALAKAELDDYALAKGQSNYDTDNWALITSYVKQGKEDIDLALNEAQADSALFVAKERIDSVEREEEAYKPYGTFCGIEEAYNQALLTREDLKNIAYYNNYGVVLNGKEETVEHAPVLKNPEVLNADIVNKIKTDFFIEYIVPFDNGFEVALDDIEIAVYCGCYNGFIAIRMMDNFDYPATVGYLVIDDLLFLSPYESGNKIILWSENIKV